MSGANEFIATLNFRTHNLGKDSTLVLTFDDEKTIPGIFEDVFPTAFKVTKFGAEGSYKFTATYKQQLGFTRAQIDHSVVVAASTYTHINPGEETTLTKSGSPPVYSFSHPKSIIPPSKLMEAKNSTNTSENIGIGFFENPDFEPSQILVATDVGVGSVAQAEFTPILRGYIVSGFKENEILKIRIKSQVLFKQNLVHLKPVTNWKITYNPGTGEYEIVEVKEIVEVEGA